jgi:integrase/recombinase XerD
MAAPRELDLTVSLDDAWTAWEKHLHARVDANTFSPDSARAYLSYSRRLVERVGAGRTCDSVEAHEIEGWLAHCKARGCPRPGWPAKPGSPSTLRLCHKSANELLKFCEARRWLRENPMREVPAPPLPPRRTAPERAALTRPELDAMIAAAHTGHGSYNGDRGCWVRDEIVIRLTAESGLRNADIQNLDLGDVESEASGRWSVQIRSGKGRKAATVPLTDTCAALILDYTDRWRPQPGTTPDRYTAHHKLVKGDAQALLLTAGRHRMRASSVRNIVQRCARYALGRHYVPHGLRHTAGTLLVREAKADVALVAKILRHSDLSATAFYLDTSDEEAAAAVNRRKTGAPAKGPRDLPPGPDDPRWPECGSREGWNRHRREKIPRCTACRMWNREETARRELGALRRRLAQRDRQIEAMGREIQRLLAEAPPQASPREPERANPCAPRAASVP